MITINVNVTNKIATASTRVAIVCGNSGYQIKFTFDSEWDAHDTKTARFIWNGRFVDVAFTGDTCPVPIISNTEALTVGVYAGELTTTTPAHLDCLKSILCGGEKLQDEPSNGEAQVDAVRDAGAQALSDIETAKEEAISEIDAKMEDLGDVVVGGNIPTFDLTEMILPYDGTAASLEMGTTEIRAALDKGVVEFKITLKLLETVSIPLSVIPSVIEANNATYSCSAFYNFDVNAQQGVINFMVSETAVTVWITDLNNKVEEKPTVTDIDLRKFAEEGQIIETYSDGTTKTIIVEYNADGNPSTITERLSTGEENVTTLIW